MKIILSRKGFDSSVGGHANPILPDGRMISLPIPSSLDRLDYAELCPIDGRSYAQIIDELGAGARIDGKGAHLDPDLIKSIRPRKPGWRPTLGQIGQAAGHLKNQRIGEGDLFLFYGWFRKTELDEGGRLRFKKHRGMHALYGYLQVDRVLNCREAAQLPVWLQDHPHAVPERTKKPTNTIYVAADRLVGNATQPGAGAFIFDDSLVLTKPGSSRSRWGLDPSLFRHLTISYHTESAWRDGYFQSYPRAQEYVIGADKGASEWAYNLVTQRDLWS